MGKKIEFSKSDLGYIVNAIDISGMSYSEVGKEFGCSRTTIWRRYKEAKVDLPETELARLSDERKQAYEDREKAFEEQKNKFGVIHIQEDKEEGFFEKVKNFFKYILLGGDSGRW